MGFVRYESMLYVSFIQGSVSLFLPNLVVDAVNPVKAGEIQIPVKKRKFKD